MNNALHIVQVGVVFLLMITILVAAHELGHYLFARLFRMGVQEFSLGFGRPKIWTWRRTKATLEDGSELVTEFNLRAWPLGGFVRILGMEATDDGSERRIPNGFYSRPAWQRFVVLLAGPVFSVVAGLLVLAPVNYIQGDLRETTRIVALDTSYGAYAAGVRPDDVVTRIDGRPVENGYEARVLVRDRLQGPIVLNVVRGGKPLEFKVTPKIADKPLPVIDESGLPTGEPRVQARLGVSFDTRGVPISFGRAFSQAVAVPIDSALGIGRIFTRPKEAENNVGGVITMVGATNSVVGQGLAETLRLAALLSISIGIFNLLPVPPLDGGQMLIAIVEMLRGGRRLSLRVQNAFFTVGFALIMTLFLGVFALDLKRLRKPAEETPKVATSPEPAHVR